MNHPRQQPRILNKGPGAQASADQHWYRIQASGEGAERRIEIEVYGDIGFWGITAADFVRDLKARDDGTSPITVAINSPGGDLFDGFAIHNALQRLGERVTARIDGACYSAASVIASGARHVAMADNALFMIHNPWAYAAGDSEELRKVADVMDQAFDGIVASYRHRPLTIDDAELRRLIAAETWLTAAEAKELGFVDEVIGGGTVKASLGQGRLLNRYQHPPKELLAQQDAPPSEPAPAPEPEPAPVPEPDAAALAAELAAECQKAGIADLTDALIQASGLQSPAAIQAELARAKAVRELCITARLPELAGPMIRDGLDATGARAKLFDKLVGKGFGEIDNTPPADSAPQPAGVKAVDPGAIYARRNQRASTGARK